MKIGIVGLRISELRGNPQKTLLGGPQRSWALYEGLRKYGFETELYVEVNAPVALDAPDLADGLVRDPSEFMNRIRGQYDYTIMILPH